MKQKSSGITVCTGTGSTSWYFNINKLTEESISDLMKISKLSGCCFVRRHVGLTPSLVVLVNQELNVSLPADNKTIVTQIAKHFNSQLLFGPSDLSMFST